MGSFFKLANSKFSSKGKIGSLKSTDGKTFTDSTNKTEILGDYFSSAFTTDDGSVPFIDPVTDDFPDGLNNVNFEPAKILKIIKKLKEGSSGGPDGIRPIFVKKLANELYIPLAHIFEYLFHAGCVPSDWKVAHITPIYKQGDPCLPSNYRPISLTSVFCKIMKSAIKDEMLIYLSRRGLLSRQQHGFLSRHSTATQLLECVQDWSVNIRNKSDLDVLYIDYTRAFDSCVHSKLLYKLTSQFEIFDALYFWIKSFLTERSQRVVVDGTVSKRYEVLSGVPQGSVLGPLLFIMFVNDVTLEFNTNVTCKLFADDLKIYSVVKSGSDYNPLDNGLEQLIAWSKKWQLGINSSKCKILHFGKKNPKYNYIINDLQIESVQHVRDLGVEVDDRLKFDHHMQNIIKKAYQRIGVLFRGFVSRDTKLMTLAYKTYIRPILEYCSEIWSPYLLKDIDAVEGVQRYFTRRIPGLKTFSYTERLFLLNLESLEVRRLKKDLVMCYKILNNFVDINCDNFFEFSVLATRGHTLKLVKPPLVKNNLQQNLFHSRIIDCWNWLPDNIVTAKSINSFKASINLCNFSGF